MQLRDVVVACTIATSSVASFAQSSCAKGTTPCQNRLSPGGRDVVRDAGALNRVVGVLNKLDPTGSRRSVRNSEVTAFEENGDAAPQTSRPRIWRHADHSVVASIGEGSSRRDITSGGAERAKLLQNGEAHEVRRAVGESFFDPFSIVLLLDDWASNDRISLSYRKGDASSQDPSYGVEASFELDNARVTRTLWVSEATGLPVKLEFCIPDIRIDGPCIASAYKFAEFEQHAGVSYPKSIDFYNSGRYVYRLVLSAVSVSN